MGISYCGLIAYDGADASSLLPDLVLVATHACASAFSVPAARESEWLASSALSDTFLISL
jgi:hypothetical protein